MKRIVILVVLLCGFSLFFGACKKGPAPAPGAWIKATVNGASWTATSYNATKTVYNGQPAIQISGAITSGKSKISGIDLYVVNWNNKQSSFVIDTSNRLVASYSNAYIPLSASVGQITIGNYDSGIVQGSFSFTADSFTVSNGSFRLAY